LHAYYYADFGQDPFINLIQVLRRKNWADHDYDTGKRHHFDT